MSIQKDAIIDALRGVWVHGPAAPGAARIDRMLAPDVDLAARLADGLQPFFAEPVEDVKVVRVRHRSDTAGSAPLTFSVGDRPAGQTGVVHIHLVAVGGVVASVEVSGRRDELVLDDEVAGSMAAALAASLVGDDGIAGHAGAPWGHDRASWDHGAARPDAQTASGVPTHRRDESGEPDADVVRTILQLAGTHPDRTAVRAGDTTVSYGRLVRLAMAHAERLNRAESAPVVSWIYRRGPETIVALLGILLSGRAYLLLSPRDPAEYHDQLVEHVGATASPDVVMSGEATETSGIPDQVTDVESVAYLVFTSGTTGLAKAVMVGRSQLTNYCTFLRRHGLCGPEVTMPVLSAPGFDAIVKQIWGQLAAGGEVRFADSDDLLGSIEIALHSEDVSINTVPSVWREVLSTHPGSAVRGSLLLGGETLRPELVAHTHEAFPNLQIVNLYGPSEGTCNATWRRVEQVRRDLVPIGRPIDGAAIAVLDDTLTPVRFGAVGQLHIAGNGVALGYAGDASRTAGCFLPSVIPGDRSGRMYATGDLVRCTPDGLVFLGRLDSQLKVNGVRVDLDVLAADLERLPSVGSAFVDVSDGRLMVYVVPTADDANALATAHIASAWRSEFRPAAVCVVSHIPRTSSGKANVATLRQAHVATAPPESGSGEGFGQPPADLPGPSAQSARATDMQRLLQLLWANALGATTPVPSDVSFHDLGGDSLRTLKLIAMYRRVLQANVGLNDFRGRHSLDDHEFVLRERVSVDTVDSALKTLQEL